MEFVPGDRSGIYTCVIPNKRRRVVLTAAESAKSAEALSYGEVWANALLSFREGAKVNSATAPGSLLGRGSYVGDFSRVK